ncbi:MAG: toxin-antitoxin (TA) system antitoxin [Anaerolineae bacterium]|nr:toxin-antitoxin (TA) system antitoxin [Anaerolineae bacterium]
MLDKTISVQKSDADWDELLALVNDGREVIIMQGDNPLMKIVSVDTSPKQIKERVLGAHPGAWMSDDFDAPLPDEFWLGEDA